ncbi:MAG: D-glycerate dehydrogenase [Pirellula sp.]|nr:D-glycerate dehydrogenase [Pirellula sp.]
MSMRKRIFVTRAIPEPGIQLLREHFDVDVWPDPLPPNRENLRSRAQGAVGLLTLLSDQVDADLMDAAGPELRGIANYAVGYNNIDVNEAKRRSIAVGNTPDVLTDATADIAIGLVLAAARHFQQGILQVRALEWRTWEPLGLLGQDLQGKTLGIIGMGRIGAAVARRLVRGWNMKLVYTSRSDKPPIDAELGGRRVHLDELLSTSDIISLHTDLNPGTKHLIQRDTLALMKRDAILVNTARGGVVDQDALYEALRSKQIFAAGLDVTDPEPLPSDSSLRQLDNCIILPHIGSATFDARNKMSIMAANNLIAAANGEPMPFPV